MTKQYPIISLNGEMYMVDKGRDWNKELQEGDWYTSHTGEVLQVKSSYMQDENNRRSSFLTHHLWSFPLFKIIAGPKELGLPLLPSIEEDINVKALLEGQKLYPSNDISSHLALGGFIGGYKAASKKQYTEEDMRQAYAEGILYQQKRSLYGNFEQFFNALNSIKLPIAVEVEMEEYDFREEWSEFTGAFETSKHRPVVDKQGFIIVKRWIWTN